ncbi:RTA1 like protein [Sanghuangporus baumii]|uniref:RTA1 like protein n=1 Tax=Sanghuangporus baumii TaxID=108892 RepID=A0A9Q5HVE0_SANBA|nr:RTA1 like protein [Sanghuangporus baumii]
MPAPLDSTTHNWPLETFHYIPDKDLAVAAAAAYGIILNIIGYRIWRRKSYWGWLAPTSAGPAGYLVFNYFVYKRVLDTFATGRDRYSLFPAELVFWCLIASTFAAFVLQDAGAGLRAIPESTGRFFFLAGVIVSAPIYGTFIIFLVHSPAMIQTIYRLAELDQGNDGELATHEKYFYTLDVLPLACAITIYAVFWPGSLIAKASTQEPAVQMSATGAYRV